MSWNWFMLSITILISRILWCGLKIWSFMEPTATKTLASLVWTGLAPKALLNATHATEITTETVPNVRHAETSSTHKPEAQNKRTVSNVYLAPKTTIQFNTPHVKTGSVMQFTNETSQWSVIRPQELPCLMMKMILNVKFAVLATFISQKRRIPI